MKDFALLVQALEHTTQTNKKVAFLKDFFSVATDQDKVWAVALFTHKRPKRQVNTKQLKEWLIDWQGLPSWLLEESYHVVGDLAETLALLVQDEGDSQKKTLDYWIRYLWGLKDLEEPDKKEKIVEAWKSFGAQERFVFNKLITGGFRIGVSKNLLIRSLSLYTGLGVDIINHRLMGDWDPFSTNFTQLVLEESPNEDASKPYPFYLAYALDDEPDTLGEEHQWSAEWKWDGIRSQLICRNNEIFLWSRGEELIIDKFPEFLSLNNFLPNGTVVDGELLPLKDGKLLDFSTLQTRIGRKNLTKKIKEEVPPVIFAYDLLEWEGRDVRNEPYSIRRGILEELTSKPGLDGLIKFSENVVFHSWDELAALREQARSYSAEGLMLKSNDSTYKVGRKRGDWWKWKVDPMTIDAVMIYAQKGHGRRADLFSDYTFAVWDGEQLVSFAKAYSGLTDKEMAEVSNWVKKNTIEKFGPVRTVTPELVFEVAFEGIQLSKRHKSGVALRFPRIHRWRRDKKKEDANTLEDLKNFLTN